MTQFDRLLQMQYAPLYDYARPRLPHKVLELTRKYLVAEPQRIVDLGCGTGLSAEPWITCGCDVIGIDVQESMLNVARQKQLPCARFLLADALSTPVETGWADVVMCSQSIHWLDPDRLWREIPRLLRPGGLFLSLNYYLMPVGDYNLEQCFFEFTKAVNTFVWRSAKTVQPYQRKHHDQHLDAILGSDELRFAHSISFSSSERFSAERFVALALSQGKVFNSLQSADLLLMDDYKRFCDRVSASFQKKELDLEISYSLILRIYE